MKEKDTSIIDENLGQISIMINGKPFRVSEGHTLSTAITSAVGVDYRTTSSGKKRGPICNMGVCYECSVFIEGVGNTRACMIKATDGMRVHAESRVNDLSESTACNSQEDSFIFETVDVAIIGAGPGGLGAAAEFINEDIRVAIIDEQQKAGGQIYRQPASSSTNNYTVHPLVNEFQEQSSIYRKFGASIWSIISVNKDGEICYAKQEHYKYRIYFDNNEIIETKYVLLSTGAYDRLIPFMGWDKPGVMSAGGIQISIKTQNYLPGKSVFLVGSHPFLIIVAQNILKAGGKVEGIAFSQSFPPGRNLLEFGFAGLKKWKKSNELLTALKLLKEEKIPLYFNTIPVEVKGTNRVESITIGKINDTGEIKTDSIQTVFCDTVGVCYGFNASSELARQMQCKSYYDEVNGGWLINIDEAMETSQPNVYAAGEITGVGGAELAEVEGRIAALSILSKFSNSTLLNYRISKLTKEMKSWRKFASMLGTATFAGDSYIDALQKNKDTVICKCENVTFQDIEETLHWNSHLSSLNSVKLMSRCGMGLCQGRYCERSLLEIVEKVTDKSVSKEAFTTRYPVKPINIGSFIK